MLRVYHSNRLDVLEEVMAYLVSSQPLDDPFEPEVILVQSTGMAQWLQMALAGKFSIAANIRFPLPASFIWDMFVTVLPDVPKESAFTKAGMSWKLMHLLPKYLSRPEFAALGHYLEEDREGRKLAQLAGRIADLYDQYLVYRPQWLSCWQRGERVPDLGESQIWQAPLWAALVEYTAQLGQPEWHRANLYQRFIDRLNNADSCPVGLPPRVFICGISALPPVYLKALEALGRHIDVHLLFTNPCRWYWGDIQDPAFLARLQSRQRQRPDGSQAGGVFPDGVVPDSLFNAEGEQNTANPLLASWGKQGRDYTFLLSELENFREVEAFADIDRDSLLHNVQADILELHNGEVMGVSLKEFESSELRRPIDSGDSSLTLNVCHSPLREVEVLHDQLLAMLERDSSLTPRDIIVMVADIDSYSPYIQSVFGSASDTRRIPFSISDRRASSAHPALQAFMELLSLPDSRFVSEDILALLEVPALAARFSIEERGLQALRQWVGESGIRWGIDDDNVRELDLPATGQHTWRFGITRMLLGYAMESQIGEWQEVLPYDASSGLIAELVGHLADLLMQLNIWRQRLGQSRTLEEWLPVVREMSGDFFSADADTEAALALLEQQWQEAIGQGISAHYQQEVSLTVLRDELARRLDNERISQRFLAGQVNFCTLMPMRSIPFRVVCLLGMNDGVYPRTLPPLGFDLMSERPKRGDRSRRDDDRYLFLEALLSARQRLYISYIGRSIQDNSERNPSVLVQELMDYVGRSYRLAKDKDLNLDQSTDRILAELTTLHTRTPFDARNFVPASPVQSYAREWLAVASGHGDAPQPFIQPLAAQPLEELEFSQLQRFWRHPVRAFFQMRLGVNFGLEESTLPDSEPFTLDTLDRFWLNQELLNCLVEQKDPQALFRRYRAAGILPYGPFGELAWEQQFAEMEPLAERVKSELRPAESLEIDLAIDGVRLTGWLPGVQSDGLLRWRPSLLRVGHGLQLWLEHLVYCAQGAGGESRLYGRKDTAWRFPGFSMSEARELLMPYIAGYRSGMDEPLIFLAESGGAWLEACYNPEQDAIDWDEETQRKAHARLLQTWQGNQRVEGEGSDLWLQRLSRTMDDAYCQLVIDNTQRYLLPLYRHRQKG
ncbi:RecBCD enzyme subunit RecC [Salmonella enterica subsp. enterica serovar Choleraesuis]|nr:RecBCD enzyme subunit RecC [Salmonella enterica subsp. enterica serovar Choleraesuis]